MTKTVGQMEGTVAQIDSFAPEIVSPLFINHGNNCRHQGSLSEEVRNGSFNWNTAWVLIFLFIQKTKVFLLPSNAGKGVVEIYASWLLSAFFSNLYYAICFSNETKDIKWYCPSVSSSLLTAKQISMDELQVEWTHGINHTAAFSNLELQASGCERTSLGLHIFLFNGCFGSETGLWTSLFI